ncbi:MAG: hypothetical protein PHF69_06835, partial [Candidatus Omnitrophica bacterium]|nr:hypothetical protein [Candidatus Omnitrophota bacterium]
DSLEKQRSAVLAQKRKLIKDAGEIEDKLEPVKPGKYQYDEQGFTYYSKIKLEDIRHLKDKEEILKAIKQPGADEAAGYSLPLVLSQSKKLTPYLLVPDIAKIEKIVADFEKKGYIPYFKKDSKGKMSHLSQLKWVKINYLNALGKDRGYEYQAFGDSSIPFVKIDTGKFLSIDNPIELTDVGAFADIIFEYKGEKISLRFDLDEQLNVQKKTFESKAGSLFVNNQTTLVADFYKGLLFKEIRDRKDGHWVSRLHLKKNGLFDKKPEQILGKLNEVAQYRKERTENFEYTQNPYLSPSLLKAQEIASASETFYHIYNNGDSRDVKISMGTMEEKILHKEGLIKSESKVIVYDKNEKEIGRFIYVPYRDFRGNIRIQTWKGVIEGKNVDAAIYVSGYDKYGIGHSSYTVINGKISAFAKYLGKDPETGVFLYTVIRGVYPEVKGLNSDLINNYRLLKNERLIPMGPVSITVLGKGGEGRLQWELSNFKKVNVAKYISGLVNETLIKDDLKDLKGFLLCFRTIVFLNYSEDISSYYEAGPLHLGYGKNGVKHAFKGSINPKDYSKTKTEGETSNLKVELDKNHNIIFIYDAEEKAPNLMSVRQKALHPLGLLVWELHEDRTIFGLPRLDKYPTVKVYYEPIYQLAHMTKKVNSDGSETLYKRHRVVFEKDNPGYFWVFSIDVEEGLLSTGRRLAHESEFFNGKWAPNNKDQIIFLPKDQAIEFGQRDGFRYFMGQKDLLRRDVYNKQPYGIVEEGEFRELSGYMDFFKGLRLSIVEYKNFMLAHITQPYFWGPAIVVGFLIMLVPLILALILPLVTRLNAKFLTRVCGLDINALMTKEARIDVAGGVDRGFSTSQRYQEVKIKIGPVSNMPPLVRYLAEVNATDNEIANQRDFWIKAVSYQLNLKLGGPISKGMRDGGLPLVNQRYVLDSYEVNYYFNYCRIHDIDPMNNLEVIIFGNLLGQVIHSRIWERYSDEGGLSSERAQFMQEVTNTIKAFNLDKRRQENEERRGVSSPLSPLPDQELYPTGYFKSFWLLLKMIKVIRDAEKSARRNQPHNSKVFSAQRQEGKKFYKIIFREWVASVLIYIAISIYWTYPEFVLPLFSWTGVLPFIVFMGLSFFAIAFANFASAFKPVRDHKRLDNVSTKHAAQDAFNILAGLKDIPEEGETTQRQAALREFRAIFKIFYRHFIENLRNSRDQPGRGPLIDEATYTEIINSIQQGNMQLPKLDNLVIEEMTRDFMNKWMINYFIIYENPQELVQILSGLSDNRGDYYKIVSLHSGYNEFKWMVFSELDSETLGEGFKDSLGALFPHSVKVISNFRKLMMVNDWEWKLFMEKLLGNITIPEELLPRNLIKKNNAAKHAADYLRTRLNIPLVEIQEKIETWANWRMEGAVKTLLSNAFSHLAVFKAWAEVLGVPENEREQWAKRRVRIVMGYGMYNAGDPTGSHTAIWHEIMQRLERLGLARGSDLEAPRVTSFNEREIDLLRRRSANDWPFISMVGNPNNIGGHISKVGSWGNWIPYIDTKLALFLDIGHRMDFSSVMFTPFLMRQFERNPNLGMVAPVYKTQYENYTSTSQSLARGHEVWDRDIRSLKDVLDSDNDFGKKYVLLSAYEESCSYIPEKNSEDTGGGNNMLRTGWEIEHTEIVDVIQSVEKVHYLGRSFVQRFGATVPELFLTRAWWEFLADENVPSAVKYGALFSFGHYPRIALTIPAVCLFLIFNLFMPWSIYVKLPLTGLFVSLINYCSNQAINMQSREYYSRRYGFWRGTLHFYVDFFKHFPVYAMYELGNFVQYILGCFGINEFTLSPRISDLIRLKFPAFWNETTIRTGFKLSAFLTPFILFMPYHPLSAAVNFIFFFVVFTWATPFFFNMRTPIRVSPLRWAGHFATDVAYIFRAQGLAYYELITKDLPNFLTKTIFRAWPAIVRLFNKIKYMQLYPAENKKWRTFGVLYTGYYARKHLDEFRKFLVVKNYYLGRIAQGNVNNVLRKAINKAEKDLRGEIIADVRNANIFKWLNLAMHMVTYVLVSVSALGVLSTIGITGLMGMFVISPVVMALLVRDVMNIFGLKSFKEEARFAPNDQNDKQIAIPRESLLGRFNISRNMIEEWTQKIGVSVKKADKEAAGLAGNEFEKIKAMSEIENRIFVWISMLAYEEFLGNDDNGAPSPIVSNKSSSPVFPFRPTSQLQEQINGLIAERGVAEKVLVGFDRGSKG